MNEFFSMAGLVIAVAAAGVSLYAVAFNGVMILRHKKEPDASPIFIIGPLFAVIAAGIFAQSQIDAGLLPWLFPVVIFCIDPAALPAIVSWLIRRNRETSKLD